MDLFDLNYEESKRQRAPLADRIRPKRLEDIVGQDHLLLKGKPLYEAISKDVLPSMILFGPPGSGKTTIARVIASYSKSSLVSLNAVTDGIPKIKEVLAEAKEELKLYGRPTVLFIDEIHRFNKTQQDALLPSLESGLITLIGATTENPFVELNRALVSRVLLFRLNAISDQDILTILNRTIEDTKDGLGHLKLSFQKKDEILSYLIQISGGDLRKSLNALEQLVNISPMAGDGSITLTLETAESLIMEKSLDYDKKGDNHYEVISAFIKSIRGSDPDAALHYLARMLESGEDPMFVARRLIILAAEDIGLADPQALSLAVSCAQAIHLIGMPEGRIPLSEAAIYLAKAPKSNSAYLAIAKAAEDVRKKDCGRVPAHLADPAKGYRYPHDYPDEDYVISQDYLPEQIRDARYYEEKKFDARQGAGRRRGEGEKP